METGMETMQEQKKTISLFRYILTVLAACLVLSFTVQAGTPFADHGALSVKGRNLVDKNKKVFQLKGVSTHGIAWFPEYVSKSTFLTLRDQWGANAVRLAMYTEEYGGYCSGGDKKQLEAVIDRGVKACTALGMYCIIDWHILSDGNPNQHLAEAKSFFAKMSKKYARNKRVLYEICNEPNGGTTWSDIKKYASKVISVIRKNAPSAVIIVGTPTWSQDVDQVAQNPMTGKKNIMYAFHFYAATHQKSMREKLKAALKAKLPVMITEFSICDASGSGSVDYTSARLWKKLINQYKLSYFAWNLSNKNETSALLKPETTRLSKWRAGDLSRTGSWIRYMIKG